MSLQHLAEQVRAKGRHGDTELVHFTKGELGGLNALARAMYGQDLPNNPYTGLPEASWLKKLLPTLAGAAATYFGGPMAGAAVGAALGGYQANRAGGDTLAGAIAGGMGGYGGGQLLTGLNAAGASAGAGTMPGTNMGVDATGGIETAVPPTPGGPPPAGGTPGGFSWDNLKRGVGALGTEEGRTAFVGTTAEKGKPATGAGGSMYSALLKAATPAIVDAAGTGTKAGAAGKPPERGEPQKYEGQWGRDENGRWVWQAENVTPKKHAEGGRVTSQNVFDYLMGEDQLNKAKYSPRVVSRGEEPATPLVGVGVPADPGPVETSFGGGDSAGEGGGSGTAPSGISAPNDAADQGNAVGAIGAPVSNAVAGMIGAAISAVTGIPGLGLAAQGLNAAIGSIEAAPPVSETNAAALSQMDAQAIENANQPAVAPAVSVSTGDAAASDDGDSADGSAGTTGAAAPGAGTSAGDTAGNTEGSGGQTGADAAAASAGAAAAAAGDSATSAGDSATSADGTAWANGGLVALQSGGFVFPADVVAAVGAGSSSAGLEALAKKFGARPVVGKGHGQSDHIPAVIDGKRKARVARDEAVLDAAQVARIGGGDGKKGAQKLYDMMARVRKQSMGTTKQMRPVKLKELA